MRSGSTSMPRNAAPFSVAASGCAPPIPPMPPLTTSLPVEVPTEMLAAGGGERFVGALQNSLRADVDPASGGHLAVHHQARRGRVRRTAPSCSSGRRDWNWRSGRAARRRACGKCRRACRIAPAAFRRFPAISATRRWRGSIPSCAPLCLARRRRSGPAAFRLPPGRGYS